MRCGSAFPAENHQTATNPTKTKPAAAIIPGANADFFLRATSYLYRPLPPAARTRCLPPLTHEFPATKNLHGKSTALLIPTLGPLATSIPAFPVRIKNPLPRANASAPCSPPSIPSARVSLPGPEHKSTTPAFPVRRCISEIPTVGSSARTSTNPSSPPPFTKKFSSQCTP